MAIWCSEIEIHQLQIISSTKWEVYLSLGNHGPKLSQVYSLGCHFFSSVFCLTMLVFILMKIIIRHKNKTFSMVIAKQFSLAITLLLCTYRFISHLGTKIDSISSLLKFHKLFFKCDTPFTTVCKSIWNKSKCCHAKHYV